MKNGIVLPVEVQAELEKVDSVTRQQILKAYADHPDHRGKRRCEVTSPPSWGNSHRYRFAPRRCRIV